MLHAANDVVEVPRLPDWPRRTASPGDFVSSLALQVSQDPNQGVFARRQQKVDMIGHDGVTEEQERTRGSLGRQNIEDGVALRGREIPDATRHISGDKENAVAILDATEANHCPIVADVARLFQRRGFSPSKAHMLCGIRTVRRRASTVVGKPPRLKTRATLSARSRCYDGPSRLWGAGAEDASTDPAAHRADARRAYRSRLGLQAEEEPG